MFLELRLKIRKFFKKHKNKIILVAIVWAVILLINYFLGHRKQQVTLNTTYTPHEVLLTSDTKVPEELQNPIEDIIDDYVNKCNNKDYLSAYELLTEDCKKNAFGDSSDEFTTYVQTIFNNKKRYSIQNYSNYGAYYIYSIKLIDDIITTGLTGQEYAYYEEKIAIKQDGDKLKLCVNNYMEYDEPKKIAEDDNLKIRVESRVKYYENEIYTVRITNKTEKTMLLYDALAGNEIALTVGESSRIPTKVNTTVVLEAGETKSFKITFAKYYDEENKSSELTFNKIRIINNYTGQEESEEELLEKSEKQYSIGISL